MRSFMSPGKRIRSFRLKRGMTQRSLGTAVGFPAKTADIRIAQYESGARTPKHGLLCALAQTLAVPISALEIPYIKSRDELEQLLQALEDEYGLTVTITEPAIDSTIEISKRQRQNERWERITSWKTSQ